ncbi:MAG: acyl-CoA dehydrogenase [Burkholderiaceae bacterium]|nr:acyl-CoA dehydrogenase [Burkholderiaceae bacterium]
MPDSLSAALCALRDRTAALARDHLVALRDDDRLTPGERAARVRGLSKAAGLFTLTQTADTPDLTLLVARETLAIHGVGHLSGLFGPPAGLLEGVGEPLRSSHLLPLLAGDKRAGFAFTEPADAPRPTWGQIDGDQLVISGRKSYVTGGADADFLTVLVEVEGQGPAMVVVDTDCPGVTLARRFSSLDGSHHAAFGFDRVRVPRHQVIGAPGQGRSRALAEISAMRRAVAADAVGTAAWVVDLVARDLQRARRGGARAASERLRLRYGEMRIQAYAARATVYRTARLADAGQDVVNESIAAKVFATEVASQLVDTAVQLAGGEALVTGHPLEQALRRLRALRLAEGETDALCVNLARGHLDLGKGRL